MKKSILMIVVLLVNRNVLLAQEDAIEANNEQNKIQIIKDFYVNITSGTGTWVSELNDFDTSDPMAFTRFILKFNWKDSISVKGQILGVNLSNDTIVFWEFWEFADLNGGFTQQVQRSPSGHYGFGRATYSYDNGRKEEIDFKYSNGSTGKHRSTHKIESKNLMISVSENYDEGQQKWIKMPPRKWIRSN